MSLINEFKRDADKSHRKKSSKQSDCSRSRTPLFVKQDRMQQAYRKHLERLKVANEKAKDSTPRALLMSSASFTKSKNSLRSKNSTRQRKKQDHSFIATDAQELKTVDKTTMHREFTSFGSKMPTTPSTSKRSSNDVNTNKEENKKSLEKDFNKGMILL